MERRNVVVRDDRLHRAMDEIAARIRPLCGQMPEAEFRILVEQMATVQLKYSMRGTTVFPPHD